MRFFLLPLLSFLATGLFAQTNTFQADFLEKWQNSRDYTLKFAHAMPAEYYSYKPTEEQMTFGKQLVHIAGNMLWLGHAYLGADEIDVDMDHPPVKKEAVIQLLERSFAYAETAVRNMDMSTLDEIVDFPADPLSRRQVMMLLSDHVTHHRGQLVVYLRLKGIEPPPYVGW